MMDTEEASSSGQNDAVRDLLTLARQLINQGKPSQALQAVIFFLLFNSLFIYFFIIIHFIKIRINNSFITCQIYLI